MFKEQVTDFKQHREQVLKAHLARDKTYLATRRNRRIAVLFAAVQVIIGTFAVLLLLKSLMMATNGQDEYARLIAPVVQGLDADHPLATALRPDRLTLTLADTIRPFISETASKDVAFGPPLPPDMTTP